MIAKYIDLARSIHVPIIELIIAYLYKVGCWITLCICHCLHMIIHIIYKYIYIYAHDFVYICGSNDWEKHPHNYGWSVPVKCPLSCSISPPNFYTRLVILWDTLFIEMINLWQEFGLHSFSSNSLNHWSCKSREHSAIRTKCERYIHLLPIVVNFLHSYMCGMRCSPGCLCLLVHAHCYRSSIIVNY